MTMTASSEDFLKKPFQLTADNFTDHMWGGQWIPEFKGLPTSSSPVGESWEVSGLPERPSFVVGDHDSRIPLSQLIEHHASYILGQKLTQAYGRRLPLLAKLIDASDDLSVQVHPHDTHLDHPQVGKSESWLILNVAPGPESGFIYLGFDPSKVDSYATRDEFIEAFFGALNQANSMGPSDDPHVRAKAARVVLPFLNRIRVKPGDVFNVKPGMIHAIGRGVRLFEIQQASDITYRVWDWNRADTKEKSKGRLAFRTLHIEQARAVLDFRAHRPSPDTIVLDQLGEQELVREAESRFLLTQIHLKTTVPFTLKTAGVFQALTVIDGEISVNGLRTKRGRSVFVPGGISEVVIASLSASAVVLRSTVPL